MTTYVDIVKAGIENSTQEIRKVANQVPDFMQSSELFQLVAVIATQEIDSRVRDVFDTIFRNTVPALVEPAFIPQWSVLLGYPLLANDSNEIARAKILSKTVHSQRRLIDIANIVRLYLSGNSTYTSATIRNTDLIPVYDPTGFTVGQTVYVGPNLAVITEVNGIEGYIRLDRYVTARIFELVSDSPVIITQIFDPIQTYDSLGDTYDSGRPYDAPPTAAYTFDIFVEKQRIISLQDIIDSVTAARPAHLNFRILAYPPLTYNQNDFTYNGVPVQSDFYNSAAQYNDNGVSYNGVSSFGSYDSPTETYDNPLRPYDDPHGSDVLYNGSEVLFGGF